MNNRATNRTWLANNGWKVGEWWEPDYCTGKWYRQFPEVEPRCQCNDDKPGVQLVLREHSRAFRGSYHTQYELELCAEAADGVWVELKAYSIPGGELRDVIESQIAKLIRAWKAANEPHAVGKGRL